MGLSEAGEARIWNNFELSFTICINYLYNVIFPNKLYETETLIPVLINACSDASLKLPTADSKKRAPFDLNYLFGCVKAAWRHCRDPFDYAAWGGGLPTTLHV